MAEYGMVTSHSQQPMVMCRDAHDDAEHQNYRLFGIK